MWYLSRPKLIPSKLLDEIEANRDECRLAVISVWEAMLLMEKGRFKVSLPPRAWVEQAMERFPINEAPLNREVAILSREVRLPHPDPADRFISATALIFELTLATVDKRLLAAKWLPTAKLR